MSFARALLQPKSSVTRSGPASRSKCALPRREAYRDHTLKSCTLVERLEIESASFWAYFDDIAGRATNAQNAMANAQLLSRVIRSLMIFLHLVEMLVANWYLIAFWNKFAVIIIMQGVTQFMKDPTAQHGNHHRARFCDGQYCVFVVQFSEL